MDRVSPLYKYIVDVAACGRNAADASAGGLFLLSLVTGNEFERRIIITMQI